VAEQYIPGDTNIANIIVTVMYKTDVAATLETLRLKGA
jgi:hypothetical protein